MALTSNHIAEWLSQFITSGAQVYNDVLPPTGRIIFVRLISGPGYDLEGIQDNIGFSVEVRGADRNPFDAEQIAWDVDAAILHNGTSPYEFSDGTYIYFVGRLGGTPASLPVPDGSGRYVFTCNYYVTVATDL